MTSVRFQLRYIGPAVNDGTMDVRQVAPALFGIGNLVDEASKEANGDAVKVTVRVVALQPGSFQIDLETARDFFGAAKALLLGADYDAINKALLLIFGPIGLIKLVKFLRGRTPDKVEPGDNNTVNITLNNTTINAPIQVYNLAKNATAVQAAASLVEPVTKPGVDSLAVIQDDVVRETVTKEEAEYFIPTDPDESSISDQTRRTALEVITLSLAGKSQWRFNEGSGTRLKAEILDQDFLKEVHEGKHSFRAGTVLSVDLRVQQAWREGRLEAKRSVVRVHKVIQPPEQPDMFDGK